MRQVLVYIPLQSWFGLLADIPIYGYGGMLFDAIFLCTWLASRLAKREGITPNLLQDLAVWGFLAGIIGARITFMIQYADKFPHWYQFFFLWDGGLVFYGSAIGGVVGYFLA